MSTYALAALYAACITLAVILARSYILPTVPLSQTLAFALVVWLGGVCFTALWHRFPW